MQQRLLSANGAKSLLLAAGFVEVSSRCEAHPTLPTALLPTTLPAHYTPCPPHSLPTTLPAHYTPCPPHSRLLQWRNTDHTQQTLLKSSHTAQPVLESSALCTTRNETNEKPCAQREQTLEFEDVSQLPLLSRVTMMLLARLPPAEPANTPEPATSEVAAPATATNISHGEAAAAKYLKDVDREISRAVDPERMAWLKEQVSMLLVSNSAQL